MITGVLQYLSPFTLSILRIVAGLLFWQRGMAKLFGWYGGEAVSFGSLIWAAGALETVGGPLIAIGLFTRPLAFLLAGEMAVAYGIAHMPQGAWPLRNGGEIALLFLLIFLMLLAAGPGKIAVDQFFSRIPTLYKVLDRFRPAMLTVFRIAVGFLFWQHGAAKFGFLGGRISEFPDLRFFAGVLEFLGGPLIVLGVYTRAVAFILCGEMAVAYWMSHAPREAGIWPLQNGGEPAVLFCFMFLFLMTTGAGKWSIDGLLSRRKGNK